jgi:hypothetical protein
MTFEVDLVQRVGCGGDEICALRATIVSGEV